MLVIQNGYECEYELRLFAGLFFGDDEDVTIYSDFKYNGRETNVYTQINYNGKAYFDDNYFKFDINGRDNKFIKKIFTCSCTRSLCACAEQIRKINLPWGVMCGIRPAKNVRELKESGYSNSQIKEIFLQIYNVSAEKTELAMRVAKNEEILLKSIGENSVSIYIGIPFCPTRCLYCSFVSTDISVSGKYMDEFVEKLLLEIDKTAEIIDKTGAHVENIYIGGGTPTTLSARQLTMICDRLKAHFDFDKIREFTVEAGRADTITREKLIAVKNGGADRISINPQTMNNETLKKVRRKHDDKMIVDCFNTARELGFDNINMDLIAGLPGESFEMFKYSLDRIIELDPENITVHSMCVKRAANLRFTDNRLTEAEQMNRMLSYTQKRMNETGREPYYMYRQKNISGNLENVGYAKKGRMSTYNVNIMEEKQTIIALGGGGSTKLVMNDRIERIFNFKDPSEYIKRFDEILKNKDKAAEVILNGG